LVSEISRERFDLSFTITLVAFLISDDPVSRWFQEYTRRAEVKVDEILAAQEIDPTRLDEMAGRELTEELLKRGPTVTASARSIFTEAAELMREVSGAEEPALLDVRHVMGAYIYRPKGHESQLRSWSFEPEGWSNAFLTQIQALFPDEFDPWLKVHLSTFGSEPRLEEIVTGGLSTHIARDRWTVDDALGYDAYAYAIARFITHPETQSPLTISIQAPWGGGKTSLMRMIQRYLDPMGLRSYEERATPSSDEGQTSEKPTVRVVRDELRRLIRKEEPRFEISGEERQGMQRLTIWFNVWKYESTEQVWAGLADAIVRQFAQRLGPIEREKFWLHLHLQRLDADKIRRTIYERIATFWWRRTYPWLLGSAATLAGSAALAITGGASDKVLLQNAGFGGMVLSALVAVLQAVAQYRGVNEEPADISLSEYVHVPDYSTELGFVHHVEADLQRVFEVIPDEFSPIVVFVDDLDRCSPDKVADVVEALNLFLAGEFRNCIFVLGMDPDMVAAALEEAHSKVIAKLPEDVASTPIGWRFMDKFVQLPFVIPPAERPDLENYARSLLSERLREREFLGAVRAAADEASPTLDDPAQIQQAAQDLALKHQLDDDQQRELGRILAQQASYRIMDRGIASFSDQDTEIRQIVLQTAREFPHNPRELKRFFNVFRFLFFLRWAREGRGRPSPSPQQLRRWIILSMKWPEVVRWLRRSYSGREGETPPGVVVSPTASRLRQLEDIGARGQNLKGWQEEITNTFQLQVEKTPWIADEDLMKFFRREGGLAPERLSDAAGMGLW